MIERPFEYIETNGITLRTVVEGDGPLVILLHGFPQCWAVWRRQIDPIVAAGFRVVVPDQRGYGGSSCPPNVSDYNIRELSADVAGLAKALGHDRFIVIGQDWGCLAAWNTALLHEDTCSAVMGLCVPFWRWGPEGLDIPGMDDKFWYARYFQTPGVAEAELEKDLSLSLRTIYHWCSGGAPAGTFMEQLNYARENGLLDVLPEPPEQLPAWLTEDDLAYLVKQYEISGFRGPINWYRNIPNNNALTPELEYKRFTQPVGFASAEFDTADEFDPNWRETLSNACEDLRFIESVKGSGHWLHLEKPDETTKLILRFLNGL